MESLKQISEESLAVPSIDSFCLNPNPGSCAGTISNENNIETTNIPSLGEGHKLTVSEKFTNSHKKICEKCIWVRKS